MIKSVVLLICAALSGSLGSASSPPGLRSQRTPPPQRVSPGWSAHQGEQAWATQELARSPRRSEWVKIPSGGRTLKAFVIYAELKEKAPFALVQWFNTSCFTSPGPYAYGNEPRVDTAIWSEGIRNFDFSALKSTKVTENTDVQFRAEFFNLFNRKQFGPPDGSLNDGTFGQVLSSDGNQPRLVQLSLRVNF